MLALSYCNIFDAPIQSIEYTQLYNIQGIYKTYEYTDEALQESIPCTDYMYCWSKFQIGTPDDIKCEFRLSVQ